jgi:hypothetical protein
VNTNYYMILQSIMDPQRVDHEQQGSPRQYGYIAKMSFSQKVFRSEKKSSQERGSQEGVQSIGR